MKDFLTRLAGWFTDSRRQAVQALITSALTLLVIVGAMSQDQSTAVVNLAASLLLLVQGAIGLVLLRPSEWYVWLNGAGRAAVYAAATALGPIGIVFELWGSERGAQIMSVATVAVSILTGFVQVLNAHTLNPVTVTTLTPIYDEVAANRLRAKIATATAESADAASTVEADPATFESERRPNGEEPTWNPPLS